MKQSDLNAHITASKVLLFLGAGASVPLSYPAMAEFMDILEAAVYAKEQQILQNIYTHYTLSDGRPGRDLEVVRSQLQRYLTFFDLAESDPNFKDLRIPQGSGEALELREAVSEIDAKIRRLIFDHYGNAPDPATVRELYGPLLTSLAELFEEPVLPVFTTNYDAAIETYAVAAGLEVEFGFAQGITRSSWQPDRFKNYALPQTRPGLVLFKLHGSVTWYRDQVGVKYVTEAQEGLRNMENMVIYPGDAKVGMLEEPYLTCYTYLRHCLQRAQHAVVMGYSFRDPILQRVFQEARLLNPGLRFVVVNGPETENMRQALTPSLGESVRLISQAFEAGDDAAYLQELAAVFTPAPSVSLEWIGKTEDLVGPGPDLYEPDGQPDGIFELCIESTRRISINRMDLHRVDSEGNDVGGRWTTASDGLTWTLGVFNRRNERVPALVVGEKKPAVVKIAASDNPEGETWFAPGQRFKLIVHLQKRPPATVYSEIPSDG